MNVGGQHYRTIWLDPKDATRLCVIDQRYLPHEFRITTLATLEDVVEAIADMQVRGAPLIGVTAAYGMYIAALYAPHNSSFIEFMDNAYKRLLDSRPTAVNLAWGLAEQRTVYTSNVSPSEAAELLRQNAERIADEDIETCKKIGDFGLNIIRQLSRFKGGRPLNILTHCNAGWLGCTDWGTATAPIYRAFNDGLALHIWVDETRPRNQGSALTAWELGQHGVPYTLITDNAGGLLMQRGRVDMVIVGTDRVARCGDVANKIGTYLKALAAKANGVPLYVAAPSSSIDWSLQSGIDIPIETRSEDEVKYVTGLTDDGEIHRVLIAPNNATASNFGFDVTPAEFIAGLITERGIALANEQALLSLFPEKKQVSAR